MKDKKVVQLEDYRINKEHEKFSEYESWEVDYDYFNKKDWNGLVKYREKAAKQNKNDPYIQWRLGDAYVLNSEYEKAIDFLSKLYIKHPNFIDVQYSILDALFALDKDENSFEWIEKPEVIRFTEDILDMCYEFLKNKRKLITISDIYCNFIIAKGYLTFKEEELFEVLKKDKRFELIDKQLGVYDVGVKVVRKNKKKS
ncbi:MAG: hypothetical protein N4A62_07430 [Marinisporobacter sp.]|jgi:tetratricopeptide (TPR) repeat protein|nr:hypothetical protein [Marinisporobacter sp.]